mmetsp:Transcript_19443/g.48572  ORF Transcript_19443/g.48572 Transcript_19443/m.48572 type:complete len:575 (+) Transcript_19443:50-1774(+)
MTERLAGKLQPRGRRADKVGMGIDRHAMLSELFMKMDADNSGTVDLAEFMGIFSAVGNKSAARDMEMIDRRVQESAQDFTNYKGHDRGQKGVKLADGFLQQDEFIFHMLEQLESKSDFQFQKIIKVYHQRIDQGERALKLRKVFMLTDVDNSGYLDVVELKVLIEAGKVGLGNARDSEPAEEPQGMYKWIKPEVLSSMDVNKNGQLEIDEWVSTLLKVEEGSTDEEFQATVDEWNAIVKNGRRVTMLRHVFTRMDADQSGSVTMGEMLHLAETELEKSAVSEVLRMIDEGYGNKDGEISEEEWITAMLDGHKNSPDEALFRDCAHQLEVLQKNQRKDWRYRYLAKDAGNLVVAMRAAGVTHLVFVRHANAVPGLSVHSGQPHDWSFDDLSRRLTNRGQAQCAAARTAWFGACPTRKTTLCSPAARAKETAAYMTFDDDSALAAAKLPCLVIDSLHPFGQAADACESLVARFGATPLRHYLDVDGGETSFGIYNLGVCRELAIKFRLSPVQREKGTYISIFGHAVWLNSVAYAVACASECSEKELEKLLDLELGEAEGILVPLYGGQIQKMVVPL